MKVGKINIHFIVLGCIRTNLQMDLIYLQVSIHKLILLIYNLFSDIV